MNMNKKLLSPRYVINDMLMKRSILLCDILPLENIGKYIDLFTIHCLLKVLLLIVKKCTDIW